jgi:chromosome segregation ATPase
VQPERWRLALALALQAGISELRFDSLTHGSNHATMGAMSNLDEYIPVEEAARILQRGTRMTEKYADKGRIRTKPAGRRRLYLRADVEQLREELNVSDMPTPKPLAQVLPPSELLELVDRKDDEIRSLNQEIAALRHRLGQVEGELNTARYLLEDKQRLDSKIEEVTSKLEAAASRIDGYRSDNERLNIEVARMQFELEFYRRELERTQQERENIKKALSSPHNNEHS